MSTGSFSQAGFYYQNNLAALKILDLLEINTDISEIELENFDKGKHIDDIIITRHNQTQFYQVKWSSDENNAYTIYNMAFQNDEEDKTLFKKMAIGFSSCYANGMPVEVILFSTRPASNQKQPANGINKSLAELIRFHRSFTASPHTVLADAEDYASFKEVLDNLITASGLSATYFDVFFKSIKFELSAPDLNQIKSQIQNKCFKLGIDLTLVDKLLDACVNWSISGEKINKQVLLARLGIADRFADRLSHIFKVDERLFVENEVLFDQLDNSLASLDGGYILVQGPPGSGKSTNLTKYLAANKDVRFAYYCFIPGDRNVADLRLKSEYFLQSLCIAIEHAFPLLDLPSRYSSDFEYKLTQYLSTISATGERLIFVIDGIDHVDRRKEDIINPLTKNILTEIPENIFIIVSSQYIEALPSAVQVKIQSEKGRHITIERFSEQQTLKYISNRSMILPDDLVKKLHEKSEGIPLYLYYILSALDDVAPTEYEGLIADFPYLQDGSINTYHALLYSQIKDDEHVNYILALLAYRKEYSSVETIIEIIRTININLTTLRVKRILSKIKHLLKERNADSYTLFHNSFREFIIAETKIISKEISDALIGYYAQDIYSEEAFRNYFSHLAFLGRDKEIISIISDTWIRQAWIKFRPIHEIESNINIGWESCVRTGSASEFVRIAYLKHEIGASRHNLDMSDFDSALYFLYGKHDKESLRVVWDGEFPLVNDGYFNFYCIKFHQTTGTLIPSDVAMQFFESFNNNFEEPSDGREGSDVLSYLKCRSLYVSPQQLLSDARYYTDFLTVKEIKKLIAYLLEEKKIGHILEFHEHVTDEVIKNYAVSAIIQGLYKLGGSDLDLYLSQFNFERLTPPEKVDFIGQLVPYIPFDTLLTAYGDLEMPLFLDNDIIDETVGYTLKKQFLSLYETLRVAFYLKPARFNEYDIQLPRLSKLNQTLYRCISSSAKLWCDNTKKSIAGPAKLTALKQIVDQLIIPHYMVEQIMIGYGRETFIRYEFHKILSIVFKLANEICSDDELKSVIEYWLIKNQGADGFVNYKNHLALTYAIKNRKKLINEAVAVIAHAESLARRDEETNAIVSGLYAVGSEYGAWEQSEDYARIYAELLSLSCGLSYRKDYSFADIFSVLAKVHIQQPDLTLHRLASLYEMLFKVRDVGDRRMFHICLSVLIDFAFQHFPKLGFQLLVKNEQNIARDETLKIVLSNMIPIAKGPDLEFIWAIIKTMGKWESDDDRDDNLYQTYLVFFKSIVAQGDIDVITNTYNYLYRQFSIEQGKATKILPFNKIIETAEIPFNKYERPQLPIAKSSNRQSDPYTTFTEPVVKNKFELHLRKINAEELLRLSRENNKDVTAYILAFIESSQFNLINSVWKEFYTNAIAGLSSWYSALAATVKKSVDSNIRQYQRLYVSAKASMATFGKPNQGALKSHILALVKTMDQSVPAAGLGLEFEQHFNFDMVLSKLIALLNRNGRMHGAITESDLTWIADNLRFSDVDYWHTIAAKYYDGEPLVKFLMALSKASFVYDERKAKDIFIQAFEVLDGMSFFNRDSQLELIKWGFQCYPEKANFYLLQSYYSAHVKQTYATVADIDRLIVPWAEKFNEAGFFQAYYNANFVYNLKLTEGLEDIHTETNFIRAHTEDQSFPVLTVGYLINLFEHPVIKVRQLAIGSLAELLIRHPELADVATDNEFHDHTPNQIEHLLMAFYSASFSIGDAIGRKIEVIARLLDDGHVNVRQLSADLIVWIISNGNARNDAFADKALKVNKVPLLPTPAIVRPLRHGTKYAMGVHQRELIIELTEYKDTFSDELYTALTDDGFDKANAMEIEGAVHRHYNLNTHFDPLEINGPGFSVVQDKLCRVVFKNIQQGAFIDAEINHVRYSLRLYDPTDLFYPRVAKPINITWRDNSDDEKRFIQFDDQDEVFNDLIMRDDKWLTIFEHGYLNEDKYPKHFSSHFHLVAFCVPKGTKESKVFKYLDQFSPHYHKDNLYRHELTTYFEKYVDGIGEVIYPIIGSSRKNFRHRNEDSVAILLPYITQMLRAHTAPGTLNLIDDQNTPVAEFIEWQEPFKSHDIRRFEPMSQGATLNIQTRLLLDFCRTSNFELYYQISLRRSTDKYKSEEKMQWHEHTFVRKYIKDERVSG